MGVTLTSPRPAHGALNWDTANEADLAALATAINYATSLAAIDVNTLNVSGYYFGSNLTNAPAGSTAVFLIHVLATQPGSIVQRATRISDNATWQRALTAGGSWTAWQVVNGDTGWSLTPIVLASGWSTLTDSNGGTTAGGVRVLNGQLEYRFSVKRSGAALTASAGGAFTSSPVAVATVNPSTYPQFVPASQIGDHFYGTNKSGAARIDASGNIGIMDTYPADTIGTNDVIQITLRGLQG